MNELVAPGPARGEVWPAWLDPVAGHEQGGERPCPIICDDQFNHSRAELVIVPPIARTDRGLVSHVSVNPVEGGLREVSESVRAR
ncbi:MAG: type II toxin-antitoxin system PemK/MazF family toxin [Bryobacteraceae bacterium]